MKKQLLFALALLFFSVQALRAQLQSGPMVGYSEMREVLLWAQTSQPAKVKFVYWDKDQPAKRFSTEEVATQKPTAFTARLIADQVLPGKKYGYELLINGKKVARPYPLEFQTQTLWQWRTDPPTFRFAFGSCSYVNEPEFDRPGPGYGSHYEMFTTIHQQRPDFMVWLGDNTYTREADWNTRTGIMHRYTHTRSLPELQPLLASTHHYATWDDHDYGPNDSDRSFWLKNVSQEAFKLFWGNPNYVFNEGVTGTFQWADVQFFLLDDRYFKSPNDNTVVDRTILGQRQFLWLIDALTFSKATFKFVVVGGQVLNPAKVAENFSNYPEEREKLIRTLTDAKVPGVIFLDGDRHYSVLSKLDRTGTYPLYDFTISPLTAGPAKPYEDENNTLMVPETLVTEHNFALAEVNGPLKDRVLKVSVMNASGKVLWTREIKASELK
jgi:alkaline phosphatase D